MDIALQVFGMISAFAAVAAYYLVTSGRLFPTGYRYLLLNLFSSLTAIVYLAILSAWASVFVQVFWLAITLKTLVDVRKAYQRQLDRVEMQRMREFVNAPGDLRESHAT